MNWKSYFPTPTKNATFRGVSYENAGAATITRATASEKRTVSELRRVRRELSYPTR